MTGIYCYYFFFQLGFLRITNFLRERRIGVANDVSATLFDAIIGMRTRKKTAVFKNTISVALLSPSVIRNIRISTVRTRLVHLGLALEPRLLAKVSKKNRICVSSSASNRERNRYSFKKWFRLARNFISLFFFGYF